MTTGEALPILVGVDGSDQSRAAIDLGVCEARLHHRPLRLVHAFVWPLLGLYLGPSPQGPPDGGLAVLPLRRTAEVLASLGRLADDQPAAQERSWVAELPDAAPGICPPAGCSWSLPPPATGIHIR